MRNLSLSTRLFLSCVAVSALLFLGTFFYVKGFSDRREREQAARNFSLALERYEELLAGRNRSAAELEAALRGPRGAAWRVARAELDASGLQLVLLGPPEALAHGLQLTSADEATLRALRASEVREVSLFAGRYLARTGAAGAKEAVALYPLAEIEQASSEILNAFAVAGLALLLLTSVFSQALAREISRPLVALRDRTRALAEHLGLEPPEEKGDEIQEIAASYLDFSNRVKEAVDHKQLALEELQEYKQDLMRSNQNLQRRLFQVKVMLSLWSERDRARDVKDFLSRFLENLLPGLPFEYGCVIIRPIADMDSETIFAKKIDLAPDRQERREEEESGRLGTQWTDLLDPEVKQFLLRESSSAIGSGRLLLGSVAGCIRPGEPPRTLQVLTLPLRQGEEPLGSVHFLTEQAQTQVPEVLLEFLRNLSSQVAAQLQIQALSYATRLDPLTRLYNRGYLNDRLREEVVRSSRKRDPFTLLLIDIDHFRLVNERHGQKLADEVLRGIATLLKRSCRGSDAVCRYQGAVLAIVLADTPMSGAKVFAENLRKAVEAERFPTGSGEPLGVTISLGLAEFPTDGDGVEALVSRADHALLQAKEGGRNTWRSAA